MSRRICGAILLLFSLVAAACSSAATGSDQATPIEDVEIPSAIASQDEQDAAPTVQINVAALGTIDSSPVWIADSQGFFEEVGIEVNFIPVSESDEVLDAVLTGRADAVAISPIPVIKALARGEEIRVSNYLNATSPGAARRAMTLVTTEFFEVEDGCDLLGTSIGVDSADSLVALAIQEMVENADCGEVDPDADDETPDEQTDGEGEDTASEESEEDRIVIDAPISERRIGQINFVEASLGTQLDLLEDRVVDAVGVFEPFRARAEERGFVERTPLDNELCRGASRCPITIIGTTSEWADGNQQLLDDFNGALNQAMEWMEAWDIAYRAELVSCCGITERDAGELVLADWIGSTATLEADMSRLVAVLRRQGRIEDQRLDLSSVIG